MTAPETGLDLDAILRTELGRKWLAEFLRRITMTPAMTGSTNRPPRHALGLSPIMATDLAEVTAALTTRQREVFSALSARWGEFVDVSTIIADSPTINSRAIRDRFKDDPKACRKFMRMAVAVAVSQLRARLLQFTIQTDIGRGYRITDEQEGSTP